MTLPCTRCEGTGFVNLDHLPNSILNEFDRSGDHDLILKAIAANGNNDVQICDCCGNSEDWYGTPGEHYGPDDPAGKLGPYAHNGGLCRCN